MDDAVYLEVEKRCHDEWNPKEQYWRNDAERKTHQVVRQTVFRCCRGTVPALTIHVVPEKSRRCPCYQGHQERDRDEKDSLRPTSPVRAMVKRVNSGDEAIETNDHDGDHTYVAEGVVAIREDIAEGCAERPSPHDKHDSKHRHAYCTNKEVGDG